MIIADRIRSQAKAKGWSLREFFRRIGLDQSIMRLWENGKASPEKHLSKIARVLETTEAYLRGETDNSNPIEKSPATGFGAELNDDIRELRSIWDRLDPDSRKELLKFAKFRESEQNQ